MSRRTLKPAASRRRWFLVWAMLLGKMDSSVQILERMGSRAERSWESRLISEEYFEITLVTCYIRIGN